jgi:hypothetical protein
MSEYGEVDERVAEFFRDAWEDGMGRYNKHLQKIYQEQKKERIEKEEKEELKKLKEKYEN